MDMSARAVMAPPVPARPLDTGLDMTTMRDLVLKTIFRTNVDSATVLAKRICMPTGATQELIDLCRDQQLLEAMGTLAAGKGGEMTYRLSDLGKKRAEAALAQSEYFGPFPVPLESYREQVKRQSIRDVAMTRDKLEGAMGHLILPPDLIDQLGPAVGSGRSILMYGPPGNGKSSISNGIRDAIGETLYVPHAIIYQGQIITVYDPIVHTPVPAAEEDTTSIRRRSGGHDPRYVHCERPVVITGGELRVDMLNLTYNPVARTYQAPLQLKSTGGVFIIDDLGRQEEPPQAIVNRWIVPLEEAKDILALQSGEKFEVPFDTLVVFSTNFHPNEIFDGAALRRIFYKIKIDGPDRDGFLKIFSLVAKKKGVPMDRDAILYLLREKYPTIDNNFANYQPIFLVDQLKAICDFEGIPYQMRPDLLDRAWANMFVKEEKIAH
ncbi:hypothetical protein BCF33_1252 [Hasllibacter halocynthiae]|uniref:ATPase n=1 Tax=Hasllibacter halocynthiae TaxID=595589 RepID=A0A2T0X9K5_9RHOB|nr:ATPase [Hasllibacter halocynthiae]PRY95630.1 hypothetical protein BCF33_1252 [Hasllibacter halocynthiae]